MVKSASGKTDMRSFTVVDVRLANNAKATFPNTMRFVNKTPAQAAQKAGHELCRMKKVKGRCVFKICVQETTQGSHNKMYTYTFKRVKLDKPVEVGDRKYYFTSKVYAEKSNNSMTNNNAKGKKQTKSSKGSKGKKQTRKSFM